MKISKITRRTLAIILVVVIVSLAIIGTIIPSQINDGSRKIDLKSISNDDKSAASQISNMTGLNMEEVLQQKTKDMNWNQVLQKIKKLGYPALKENQLKAKNQLLKNSVSEKDVDQLRKEGFSEEVIDNVTLLCERVEFQLDDLMETNDALVKKPVIDTLIEKEEDEKIELFKLIKENFNNKTAIYLILKLSKEFGSNEKVMDEYLLSLQLQIDLETYLLDKKQYLKIKDEKLISFDIRKAITIEKIEDAINSKHSKQSDSPINNQSNKKESSNKNDSPVNVATAPDLIKPDVKSVIPENPANSILKDIGDLENINN